MVQSEAMKTSLILARRTGAIFGFGAAKLGCMTMPNVLEDKPMQPLKVPESIVYKPISMSKLLEVRAADDVLEELAKLCLFIHI